MDSPKWSFKKNYNNMDARRRREKKKTAIFFFFFFVYFFLLFDFLFIGIIFASVIYFLLFVWGNLFMYTEERVSMNVC